MYKVLVVDDERETCTSICNYFPWGELGFEVAGQAEDGKKALQFLKNNHVDIILCDIRMPVMSGIELAKYVFEQKIPVKIIFLSGYRDFEFMQQALIYGVRNYVLKPTRYNELKQVFIRIKIELDGERAFGAAEEEGTAETMINVIKRFIGDNIGKASLQTVADYVRLNPNYVSQYFKRQTGQNFSEYLIEQKMEKAKQLLQNVQNRVYEVGEMVGYSSSKTFTRMFTRYYGQNPREFRLSKIEENK